MSSNLSPKLNRTIESFEKSPQIDITKQEVGRMFEVRSGHTKYTIVVVNPEKQEVAMKTDNKNMTGTDIWLILGSGIGVSLMKSGFIVVGARMQMRRLSGGVIETSPIKSFSLMDDPLEAKRIIDEAESRRPPFMTEEEQKADDKDFARKVEEIITTEFLPDQHKWIRNTVGLFGNNPAKSVVLGVLSQAQKYGKLEEAKKLLHRDWAENWCYQPPRFAGDPEFHPRNAYMWESLFKELGLPLPGKK